MAPPRIIAHRANLFGRNPALENSPLAIERALQAGFDVEIDVRWVAEAGGWMLGHDGPEHSVEQRLLCDPRVWCHAKDAEALANLMEIGAHCFGHDRDEFVLTSQGFVWAYPGAAVPAFRGVLVLPENVTTEYTPAVLERLGGICTDYPNAFRELCSGF